MPQTVLYYHTNCAISCKSQGSPEQSTIVPQSRSCRIGDEYNLDIFSIVQYVGRV